MIPISARTGVPIGVKTLAALRMAALAEEPPGSDDGVSRASVNLGAARAKTETAEQKKARKQAQKEAKRQKKAQKKVRLP